MRSKFLLQWCTVGKLKRKKGESNTIPTHKAVNLKLRMEWTWQYCHVGFSANSSPGSRSLCKLTSSQLEKHCSLKRKRELRGLRQGGVSCACAALTPGLSPVVLQEDSLSLPITISGAHCFSSQPMVFPFYSASKHITNPPPTPKRLELWKRSQWGRPLLL